MMSETVGNLPGKADGDFDRLTVLRRAGVAHALWEPDADRLVHGAFDAFENPQTSQPTSSQ